MNTPPPSDALRDSTRALHRRAERSGFIRDLFRGEADITGYALLLSTLLPAYRTMEQALVACRLGGPDWQHLHRAPAIASDLAALYGADWADRLPELPAARRYERRVARAAARGRAALLAHAYVRYLGDLSGGQILRRVLAGRLGLPAAALSFYEFPGIADLAAFKQEFRHAIDQAMTREDDRAALLHEAAVAFRLNIAVSEAVHDARRAAAAPGAAA